MSEWVSWGHALYLGVLAGLTSLGFLPVIQTVAWNLVLKCSRVPLAKRQQLALDAARRHLGVADPPSQAAPDPPGEREEATP